jgi:cobalt/nickel transport system permease protein
MHIPDGLLDTKTWLSLNIISASFTGITVKKLKEHMDEKKVPLMGVMAAFIFAAQMLNFPIGGGTSGHFMGGVLASVLLGPLAGFLVMATVLIVQSLIFQDGGILALGANIFNMGIIGSAGGYYAYLLITKLIKDRKGIISGSFIASWLSIVMASVACSIELAMSGKIPITIVLPAMAGVHAVIGIGEGIITSSAIIFLLNTRSDLIERAEVKI